jgi:hypothetical protein
VALYGFIGAIDQERLQVAGDCLVHRGVTQMTRNLGGHAVEEDKQVSIAWSGTLHPRSDSLLQSYRKHGIAFVRQLNGEFIIAV